MKIQKGNPDVKLYGKYLWVTVSDRKNKAQIKALVDAWYLQHARIKFEERFKNIQPILDREGLQMNSIIIRKLDKRWDSCTPKKNIDINSDLIKAPIHCIDYVILHEVCHLKHHHHGPKFWSLLKKYCPEWVKLKDRLEQGNWI